MQCDRCGFESAAGMRFCGTCGARLGETLAVSAVEPDGGRAQRRQVTVLFSDVVDSTVLAEQLDPEDFRDVLSGYSNACARAIEHFGGYVAQYQGDGVIAYFGYPRAHEDDAQRAVHAALEILEEVAALNGRLRELLDVSLELRVGLHTGMAVAGEMGTGPTRERHAAVGETLHVAARVQTLAAPGTVVVTDSTLELIGDEFDTESLGAQTLKGISHPITVHEVRGVVSSTDALERVKAPTVRPLVDRTEEQTRLGDAWRKAALGFGTVVYCSGEAGIGKSRLVHDLREVARKAGGSERLLQCSAHHTSSELYPAIRFLERHLDLERVQAAEPRLSAIEECARAAGLDPAETVPLLADLLTVPGGGPPGELTPRDARIALLRALEVLLTDTAGTPLLLIVEDLHWADPTTLELLERIVANIRSKRVACVLTFRREFHPPWTHHPEPVQIELGPLSGNDVRAMVATTTGTDLGAEDLRRVESATEGVPMFVEEMVKALAAERCTQVRLDSSVPPTLRGLLGERLDRLPELAGVIDVAAVLGREFERGLMETLAPLDRRAFASALSRLAAEEILRPVEGSRTRLEFRHALLQEAAYDRLLRRRRRVLHERAAEVLSAPSVIYAGTEPERIAHHWSLAGRPNKALAYWELAGRRALKRAAFLEAAEHFRRAVDELDAARLQSRGDAARGDLLTHLGAAMQAGTSPAAEVGAVYAQATTACERAGRREQLIPVLRGQCLYHVARGELDATLALAGEMRAMGQRDERRAWLAEGQYYLGLGHMLKGELSPGRVALEDASRLYRPDAHTDHIPEAHSDPGVGALAYLSSLLWHQGYADEATDASERSLTLAELVGGSVTLAQAWGMHCVLLLFRGRAAEFVKWVEKTRVHSAERNVGYWSTVCSIWSAWLQGHAGSPATASTEVRDLLEAYLESGARVGAAHFFGLLADLELLAGDRPQALASLDRGQAHIDETRERYYEPDLQWYLARTLMAGDTPDPATAAKAYERSMNVAAAQGSRLLQLRAAAALTRLQQKTGEQETARALVESLADEFPAESQVPDVLYARSLLERQPVHP